jgi:nucleoside-diphosphate-sugar epimerase
VASPVLVTGGTGRLGKLVVARLRDSGREVRVLARHDRPVPPGVRFFAADLRAGPGTEPAVTGAAAIIHCATSTKGDAEATRNLVTVRIPGTRAVRDGALLPPPGHTTGSRTWDQFLTIELRQHAAAPA